MQNKFTKHSVDSAFNTDEPISQTFKPNQEPKMNPKNEIKNETGKGDEELTIKTKTPNAENRKEYNKPPIVIEKLQHPEGTKNEMDSLYQNIKKLYAIKDVVKLKFNNDLMIMTDPNCYSYVPNVTSVNNEIPKHLAYVNNNKKKYFVFNKEVNGKQNFENALEERDKLQEEQGVHYLNIQEINDIITKNTIGNPRPIITPEIKEAFVIFYKQINLDLQNNPVNLVGNLALICNMNVLATALLENDADTIVSSLKDLHKAKINFNNNNVAIHLQSPSPISRSVATVISAVVGAIVGFGVAALITAFTLGFGAPAGVLAGIGVGSAVGGALLTGLLGNGISLFRSNKVKKHNEKSKRIYEHPVNENVGQAVDKVIESAKLVNNTIQEEIENYIETEQLYI